MSKDIKVDVNIDENCGTGTLIVREGQAAEVNNPRSASHGGYTVQAPFKFFEKIGSHYKSESDLVVEKSAVVSINYDEGSVKLDVNPHDNLAPSIEGSIKAAPEIAGLKINSSKRWSADDLVNYLRQNPQILVLPDDENVRTFTRKFSDLKFKVSKEVEKKDDDRGNLVDNFLQTITSDDLPKTLRVKGLLHKGGTPVEIDVEIGLEATQRSIAFYFFSPDYELLKLKEVKELIDAEVAKFNGSEICVIELN